MQFSPVPFPARQRARTAVAALVVFLPLFLSKRSPAATPGASPSPERVAPAPVGLWHAELVPTEGHEVFFDIRIVTKGPALSATLLNGASESPFTSAVWDGSRLTLAIANYDAKLEAGLRDGKLEGRYTRVVAAGLAEVPFRATRVARPALPKPKGDASIEGSWGVEMTEPRRTEKLTGIFRQRGADVTGTLLSTTGDYGALHGTFDGERLILAVFDGVHVYRFDAEMLPDGTLAGDYRSRVNPPVSWTAKRLAPAAADAFLPGSFDIVKPKDPAAPYVVAFPDVDGRMVSTADPRFANRPMIVSFMGTWCPNCADEAPFLRDLAAKYGSKGLDVVSLAFEYTNDLERNRRQVKRFIERFATPYTILLAGTVADAPNSSAMAPLVGWQGYPTTIFLDRRHRVVKIHSGFDGPATGERFTRLKKEIDAEVEALLKTTG
jgi:thiol-disulfide isomerase/thioredoxin